MNKKNYYKMFEIETDAIMTSIIKYIEGLPAIINLEQKSDIQDKLIWIRDYFNIITNTNCVY